MHDSIAIISDIHSNSFALEAVLQVLKVSRLNLAQFHRNTFFVVTVTCLNQYIYRVVS